MDNSRECRDVCMRSSGLVHARAKWSSAKAQMEIRTQELWDLCIATSAKRRTRRLRRPDCLQTKWQIADPQRGRYKTSPRKAGSPTKAVLVLPERKAATQKAALNSRESKLNRQRFRTPVDDRCSLQLDA